MIRGLSRRDTEPKFGQRHALETAHMSMPGRKERNNHDVSRLTIFSMWGSDLVDAY